MIRRCLTGLVALLACAEMGFGNPAGPTAETPVASAAVEDLASGAYHEILFEKVLVVIKAPTANQVSQSIEITSDGTCLYEIEERPKRGEEEAWPPARLVCKMEKNRLLQLQKLLEATQWLTAPAGEGIAPGIKIHEEEYAGELEITLFRDGKQFQAIISLGSRRGPYQSLMQFFRGVFEQENILYRMTRVKDAKVRQRAAGKLRSWISGYRRESGTMYPPFEIDCSRYREHFARFLQRPFDRQDWEVITAMELMAFLGDATHRETIVHLLRDREGSVREAAAKAVVDLNIEEAIPVLADVVGATEKAGWRLICLGEPAVPAVVSVIGHYNPEDKDDIRHERMIRVYIDNWKDVPKPIDPRVTKAVQKSMRTMLFANGRLEYHREFLQLVGAPESRPLDPRETAEAVLEALLSGQETIVMDSRRSEAARKAFGELGAPTVLKVEKVVADKHDVLVVTDVVDGPDGPMGRLVFYIGQHGPVWKLNAVVVEPPERLGHYLERFMAAHPDAQELPEVREDRGRPQR